MSCPTSLPSTSREAIAQEEVEASLRGLAAAWEPGELDFPAPPTWDPARAGVYFAKDRLAALGLGEPVLLDRDGNAIER